MEKIIEVKNLTKVYKQANADIIIFENLSFEIYRGDFISIIGPSGSGKTTFLNIISTLDSKYTGTVKFKGKDISVINETEKSKIRLKEIGFIFQFDSLLDDFTVIENIDIPAFIVNNKRNLKKAEEFLKKFSIEKLAYKMPQELSGGEKQRIALLRAIRNSPSLIIADEPTGNLDNENALKIMKDFKKLNDEGATIVMVTHNINLAEEFSKKIYLVENKKLINKSYEMRKMQ
ncbi:MAG: ABC transporter ATP-binding protein [Elusimicrobiota bacterium]